jgi:nucleoid-associated protein YgaU
MKDILERLHDNQLWLHRDGFRTTADNARDAAAEIARLRQQIATHTASQIDRDKQVAEACAKAVGAFIKPEWVRNSDGEVVSKPAQTDEIIVRAVYMLQSGVWRKYMEVK